HASRSAAWAAVEALVKVGSSTERRVRRPSPSMLSRSSRLSADRRLPGDYEKTQTGARGAGGWLRRPLRLAGPTGSRSPRGRATRAGRAERIDPRPEDHVETAGAQPRT